MATPLHPMPGVETGPIGANLAQRVQEFRETRRLGYAELSRKLAEMGGRDRRSGCAEPSPLTAELMWMG